MKSKNADNALPPKFRLGEYVIESVLGVGGFGITYRAKDTRLDSWVAIKEYFPQSFALRDNSHAITPYSTESTDSANENYQWGLKEFLKEARALAKFKHPHIVRVLRFLEANGTAYMVMDYEEGESLSAYLKKTGGFLSESKVNSIFIPILSGLQAVHDAGLLHLDIKPGNIYLRTNGQPLLIDFGSSRRAKSKKSKKEERVALTPAYSPVELYPDVGGKRGPWSDVYSMGATVYRCITGKKPIDALERYQTKKQNHPDPLKRATDIEKPNYSNYIREAVVSAMKIIPKNRPQSAYALQLALMGQNVREVRNLKRPSDNFRALNVVPAEFVAGQRKKSKVRGFFEKLFFFTVITVALVFFTVQGLILAGVITEDAVYDYIDRTSVATVDFLYKTDSSFKSGFGISFMPKKKLTTDKLRKPEVKLVAAFSPAKTLAFTLNGHKRRITGLAFMAKDSILVSSSLDGDIRLWKVSTGEQIQKLRQDPGGYGVMAVSPDGQWLARAASNNTVKLWDARNDKNGPTFSGHTNTINKIIFAPNSNILVTASDDKTVRLWGVKQKKQLAELKGHKYKVLTLAFLPTGSQLASGDSNGEVHYWSIPAGISLAKIQANTKKKTMDVVVYSPNSEIIATAGSNGFLKLWGTRQVFKDKVLIEGGSPIMDAVFSPDSKFLLVAGADKSVSFWEVFSGNRVHRLVGHQHPVSAVAISSDGHWVASGTTGNTVRLWKTLKTK